MNSFTFVFITLALLYGGGWWRLRSRSRPWPFWRLAIFCLAALAVIVTLSPPLMRWAHHDFRGHMMVHLVAGMIAPLGFVMASPASLALKSVPPAWGRRWVKLVSSLPVRLLSHPITAALLNIGGMYLLYMMGLYGYMLGSTAFSGWIHWHFIIAGCLFTWSIAGPDTAPQRPSLELRFGVLFLSMVAHATLAKWMYQFNLPSVMPLEEVQQGAELMFYIGESVEVFLAYLLVRQWARSRIQLHANEVNR